MRYLWEYIRFLWKSKNEHAVHSPFVFSLITKCLYNKTHFPIYRQFQEKKRGISVRNQKLLFRLVTYFQVKNILIYEEGNELNAFFSTFFQLNTTENRVDFLVLNTEIALNRSFFQKLHNDSVIFVLNPYKNKIRKDFWRKLSENEMITASVDCFGFGLAFLRKEQGKEFFYIRR